MKTQRRSLTPAEELESLRMAKHFPLIARGHGSTHRGDTSENGVFTIGHNCNAKACPGPGDTRHQQGRYTAAENYILERD